MGRVDVKAIDVAMRARLTRCRKGDLVVVSGNVNKRSNHNEQGDSIIGRSIIADYSVGGRKPERAAREPSAARRRPAPAGGRDKPPAGPGRPRGGGFRTTTGPG